MSFQDDALSEPPQDSIIPDISDLQLNTTDSADPVQPVSGTLPGCQEYVLDRLVPSTAPKDDTHCSICRQQWEDKANEQVVSTTCKHFFHKTCLVVWFIGEGLDHGTCPVCRQVLYTNISEEDSDAESNAATEILSEAEVAEPLYYALLSVYKDCARQLEEAGILANTNDPNRYSTALDFMKSSAIPALRDVVGDEPLEDSFLEYFLVHQFAYRNMAAWTLSVTEWNLCLDELASLSDQLRQKDPTQMQRLEYMVPHLNIELEIPYGEPTSISWDLIDESAAPVASGRENLNEPAGVIHSSRWRHEMCFNTVLHAIWLQTRSRVYWTWSQSMRFYGCADMFLRHITRLNMTDGMEIGLTMYDGSQLFMRAHYYGPLQN